MWWRPLGYDGALLCCHVLPLLPCHSPTAIPFPPAPPLLQREIEVDEFSYHYTVSEKPHIQNDTITSERWEGCELVLGVLAHAVACCACFGMSTAHSRRTFPWTHPVGLEYAPPLHPLAPAVVNYRLAKDHLIKLSISHALAQSTKLSVYEARSQRGRGC